MTRSRPWWPPRHARVAQQNAPSGEVHLARGLDAPSGEVCLAQGLDAPSGEVRLARGLNAPSGEVGLARGLNTPSGKVCLAQGMNAPSSKVHLARGPPRARRPRSCSCVRAFNALTPQDRATTLTRLGITPRCCSTNSLGEAIAATV
jgi:hypothetical protein